MSYPVVFKRSWSKRPIDVTWELPAGVTVAECAVTATEFIPPKWEGEDKTLTVLVSGTAAVDGDTASAVAQGGESKRRYLLRFQAAFSDGVSRDEKVVMLIVDDDHASG
jgi:hypothetical protein